MVNIEDHNGQWIFITPVKGVILTPEINNEFPIIRSTLITGQKLARARKRFGIPERISKLRKDNSAIDKLFDDHYLFAVIRNTGKSMALI